MPHGHCGDGAAFGLQWVICPLNHAMIVAEGPYRFRATVFNLLFCFLVTKKNIITCHTKEVQRKH